MTATTKTAKRTKATPRNKPRVSRKAASPKKQLRIRSELLPDTAVYGTFANREYVMIPVEDFGEWYEDTTLGAIAQDRLENDAEEPIPLEDVIAKFNKRKTGK